jgi:hypothetical protein
MRYVCGASSRSHARQSEADRYCDHAARTRKIGEKTSEKIDEDIPKDSHAHVSRHPGRIPELIGGGGFHITSSLVRRIVGMGQSRIDLRWSLFNLTHFPFDPFDPLDSLEQKRNNVLLMFQYQEEAMLKTFVEEAAALASIALFVAMIAIWAQLIPQL